MQVRRRAARLLRGGASAAVAVILAGALAAGTPVALRGAGPSGQATTADSGATASARHMATMHEQMRADHAAADARLRPLLERMNTVQGQARVDAMAAVIAELVGQRAAMQSQMDHMAQMMTPGIAGTMMPGMAMDTSGMAERCPMMKGMGMTQVAPKP